MVKKAFANGAATFAVHAARCVQRMSKCFLGFRKKKETRCDLKNGGEKVQKLKDMQKGKKEKKEFLFQRIY